MDSVSFKAVVQILLETVVDNEFISVFSQKEEILFKPTRCEVQVFLPLGPSNFDIISFFYIRSISS